MHPTVKVALLWLGFAGSHMILSHVPIRRKLVQRLGEQPFRGLYSLVSFVFFVPLVWSYASAKHSGPWLWSISVGPVLQLFLNAAMGIAFILLAASFVQPSPASVVPGKPSAHGALRITRHPLFMSFVIFGLVHLVGNGSTTDVVLSRCTSFRRIGTCDRIMCDPAKPSQRSATFTVGCMSPLPPGDCRRRRADHRGALLPRLVVRRMKNAASGKRKAQS
jgi:uncharacterized membrane protein